MQEYEEIKKIGRGSYGDVFLCRHKETQQEVADKRIDMNFLGDSERAMVFEEAKIMDMFSQSKHPHVVIFLEHCQLRGVFHFYTEYCTGGSLEDEMKQKKERKECYEETQILSYIYQIANGLAFIHEKKVIHRDLKPANILKSGEGVLKIADFGVGTALSRTGSERKTKAGSLAYMAPEVIESDEDHPYSCPCDVWSLGATAYEMITMRLPFSARNEHAMGQMIIKSPFDPIQNDISRDLETLLTRTMEKKPSDRPSSKAISELDFLFAAYKEDTQGAAAAVGRLDIDDRRQVKTKPARKPEPKPTTPEPEEDAKVSKEELDVFSQQWRASGDAPTLLHYLAHKGAPEPLADALIASHKAHVEAKDIRNNWTPLHVASVNGRVEVVNALLKHKAHVEAKDYLKQTPLHVASLNGRVEVVNALLKHKADIEAKDNNNWTPLHWASRNGRVEVVNALLKHKADVEAKDEWNQTPLHVASRNGTVEVVNALLKHKAHVEAKDNGNTIPLHVASQFDAFTQQWRKSGDAPTLLHYLAQQGAPETLADTLIATNKADVEVKDNSNWTPLHWASRYGHVEVVNALLKHKADVEAKDEWNQTPLHLASRYGHVEVVNALLKHKADVEAKDEFNSTPLHVANFYEKVEVMRVLVQAGADVNHCEECAQKCRSMRK